MTTKRLMEKFLSGKPIELTESSPATYKVREILEKEGTWGDYDFCGSVYWNKNKTVAVLVW